MAKLRYAYVLMLLFLAVLAQKPLKNADVLDMLGAGLSQEIVIAKIKSSACQFDTSPEQLKKLQADGIPEPVLVAMIEAASTKADPEPAPLPKPRKLGNAPRLYIETEQGQDTFSGIFGGVYTTNNLDPVPEIARKLIERAQEDEVPLEIVFDREKADFKWVLGRENKWNSKMYVWVLVDTATGQPIAHGKENWFRNAVKDAIQFLKFGWNARVAANQSLEVAEQIGHEDIKNIQVSVQLPSKTLKKGEKNALDARVSVSGTHQKLRVRLLSIAPNIAKVGIPARDEIVLVTSGGDPNEANFKVVGLGKKGTYNVAAFIIGVVE